MADYNKILDAGDVDAGVINVVNEISKGSKLKIEWDRGRAIFILDRVEPGIFAKPTNYGFIPQTLDEDGDELDALIICDESMPTGVVISGRVIGVLNFEDGGEMDHKIVVVPADDRDMGKSISTLEDVPEQSRKQIAHHFSHYKDLKRPGTTTVHGWGDIDAAKRIIKECQKNWKQHN